MKSKLAARFHFLNILFIVCILIVTVVACGILIARLADATSRDYVRSYTIESVDILSLHLNKELSLIQQISQTPEIIEWFADEENPDKKAAAYQTMMIYADILQIGRLHFGLMDSLHEYRIDHGAPFEDFAPVNLLDPSDSRNRWFFTASRSLFNKTMNLSTRNDEDTRLLWIDHKVMKDGNTIGIFSAALDYDEIFYDLFGLYDQESVMGFVIDYRGIIQIDSTVPEPGLIREEAHILSIDTDADFVSAINDRYLRNPGIYDGRRTTPEVIRLTGGNYQYLSIAPVPNTNWLTITFYNSNALFDFTSVLPLISAVALAFFVYVAASAFLMRRLVFGPLNQFTQSVSVSGRDENDIYGIARDDEIGELARTAQEAFSRLNENAIALKAAAEEANAANRYKSSFLANMSHEIRTPLNVIIGTTEILMQDEQLENSISTELHTIHNSGDMLLNIINDILDLSKIEAGKLKLTPNKYELASLIHDTSALNMMRTGSKAVEFKLLIDENLPAALIGDELRIKQILNNLLSNACKYTEEGEIGLSFTHEEGWLVFRVRDTGLGMTEEQINMLFDEYTRFNFEANRVTQGTGLGMSITRNLVHLMNGEISVESEPQKGSVFTVRLPQERAGPDILGRELADNLQNFHLSGILHAKKSRIIYEPMPYGRILIVDDVESNLFVAKGLVAPYGLSAETVISGPLAIAKIEAGNVYDVVFMDHMMPKMDGVEATKIIRGMGYTHPIIALTANAVIGQQDMFLANGFDDFIPKPVDIRLLNEILKKFVRDKQPPEVLEAVRQQMTAQPGPSIDDVVAVSPQLAEYLLRDILNAVEVLAAMDEKHGVYEDEDVQVFTLSVHAMRSVLTNAGEPELSAAAAKLEQAGKKNERAVISAGLPDFLDGLRATAAKLTPSEEEQHDVEIADADYAYLHEKLRLVKEACERYDQKSAKENLAELRQRTWPQQINKRLGEMAELLLGGDFDLAIDAADQTIGDNNG